MTRYRLLVLAPLLLLAAPLRADAQYYPYYQFSNPDSSLRLKFTPRDAHVYVDGYFAGQIDSFDGSFERLRLPPGQHEVVIYKPGFRSWRQRLYLSSSATRTFQGELLPLAAGEAQEPEPTPQDMPQGATFAYPDDDGSGPVTAQPGSPMPPSRPPAPAMPRQPRSPASPRPPASPQAPNPSTAPVTAGNLSIRVQPEGSTVLVDGERWVGPADNERLIVQVNAGRHKVEVLHDGFAPFTTEVDVTAGQTLPVNISLTR